MSGPYLLPALALFTLVAFIGIAMWSKKRTKDRLQNDDAPKSSLAKDGPGPQPFR